MANEEQSQAEVQPEVTGEAAPTEEAPQVDYAALNEKIAGLGDGYSIDNIVDKTQDLLSGMNDAQRGFAEYKQRMSTMEPVVDFMEKDPAYRDYLRRQTLEYIQGGPAKPRETDAYYGESPPQAPQGPANPAISGAFDPVQQRLAEVETQLYDQQMNAAIDKIASSHPVDDVTRNRIWGEVQKTGNPDVEAHYWKLMGPTLLKNAQGEAAKETAEEISRNNQSYVPNTAQSHVPNPAADIANMEQRDIDTMMENELNDMFGPRSGG